MTIGARKRPVPGVGRRPSNCTAYISQIGIAASVFGSQCDPKILDAAAESEIPLEHEVKRYFRRAGLEPSYARLSRLRPLGQLTLAHFLLFATISNAANNRDPEFNEAPFLGSEIEETVTAWASRAAPCAKTCPLSPS
jgi:hypothetical protein